jgi:hypothetical protein
MFRKALMIVMLSLSFFATSQISSAEDPLPMCNPCPWAK